ncbi:MAG: signal peptidase I [Eubacterium sp.]|nr:signal peptidase I [Eubacterium sp.]
MPGEDEVLEPKNKVWKEIFSWVKIIVIALVIALIINNFIIINANVPSGSMENTIMTGDRMIGLRTAYWFSSPKRGQVVIFKFPDNEDETFVKRVIGLPGETVHIKKGKIYINNSKKALKEDYLKEEWVEGNDYEKPFKVPKDSYFCMGDNRNVSNDARYWKKKYVKKNKILAKAEFVYWPWSNKKIIHTADYDK